MLNSTEITESLIDIERVIASKNPSLLKVIPGFVIRYLKRITHQDAINGYIFRNREKFGLEFIDAILNEFGADIQVTDARCQIPDKKDNPVSGIRHLASGGRFIIASNHPLGGLDGMALMQAVGRIRKDLVFPVNDILMNVPGLQPLFIPINKHGKNTENARIIDETFASGKVVLYFPAGLVSRKQKGGVIRDLEWKKTFITKARRYHRDVVPVHISGQNSNFFYNLSNWRHRLGIKANLEMLYLVDEMVKQKDKPIRITFGNPIPWTTFDKSRTDSEWAETVKEIVYSLADD